MKVHVHVSLKPGVLDPQGRAIHHALEGLGFDGVNDVRAGRLIELDVDDNVSDEALDEDAGRDGDSVGALAVDDGVLDREQYRVLADGGAGRRRRRRVASGCD